MSKTSIETYRGKVKAAHRYEVVTTTAKKTMAGKKFHFIGAGGVGMTGLAKLLLKN